MTAWLDVAPTELAAIRRLASRLVFHYRASGDPADHGCAAERMGEIDLRYADDMLARLHDLNPDLTANRGDTERILGCCRDFTLLFVTLCRHVGMPARSRVGFANYLIDGWYLDHVIAEVWDGERWRMVEPQLPDGFPLDLLDVPRDGFLVGADAWIACRDGRLDPESFVVAPGVPDPKLRSWPYLAHNLVLDLAAVNRREALLWETWGALERLSVPDAAMSAELDDLAAALARPDLDLDDLARRYADERFRIPREVTHHSPLDGSRRRVVLRESVAG